MNHAHLRFEVSINGERKCVAGIQQFGVMTAGLTWVRRSPKEMPQDFAKNPEFDRDEWLREAIVLDVGGLDSGHSARWIAEELSVGDVVTVRVLGEGESDDPNECRLEGGGQESAT